MARCYAFLTAASFSRSTTRSLQNEKGLMGRELQCLDALVLLTPVVSLLALRGLSARSKRNAVQDDLREAADRGSDIPGVRHIAAPLASSSSWRLGMSSSESMGPRQVARRMAAATDHREERAGWPR
jgi:hypothetical protein